MREAETHVEVIPETRFATVEQVMVDSVIGLGSTVNITTALRVGRTEDREVELALSVPDTLFPGFYQLEVGSAATLGPDELLFAPPQYGPPIEESLDDVFARLNKPDENVLLKARLAFVAPFPPPPPPPELPPELPPEGEGEGDPEGDPEGEGDGDEGNEGENGEGEGEGENGDGENGDPEGGFDEPPPGAFPPGPAAPSPWAYFYAARRRFIAPRYSTSLI